MGQRDVELALNLRTAFIRNVAEYEGNMDIQESQVEAIRRVTGEVATRVTRLVAQVR